MTRGTTSSKLSLTVRDTPVQLRLRAWSQLIRTYQVALREITSLLLGHEMTVPQFDVLATLRYGEGVTQQELAARLLVTKGNVCGLLDRLERVGWVERRQDEKDARANRLHLTPAGRRLIDKVLPQHDELVLTLLGSVGDGEVALLRAALMAIENTAGAE